MFYEFTIGIKYCHSRIFPTIGYIRRDESLPFDISGKQISIEGILEPPFLNEGNNQKATFMIRTHEEKTNETIKDINYRIIAKFKNQTIMDQRFHSLDGIVSANLIPLNNSNIHDLFFLITMIMEIAAAMGNNTITF